MTSDQNKNPAPTIVESSTTLVLPPSETAKIFYIVLALSSVAMLGFAAIILLIILFPNSDIAWLGLLFLAFFPVAIVFYVSCFGSVIFAVRRKIAARKTQLKVRWFDYAVFAVFLLSLVLPFSARVYSVKVKQPRDARKQAAFEQEVAEHNKKQARVQLLTDAQSVFGSGNVYLPETNQSIEVTKSTILTFRKEPGSIVYELVLKDSNRAISLTATKETGSGSFCVLPESASDKRFTSLCTQVKSPVDYAVIYRDSSLQAASHVSGAYYSFRIGNVYYLAQQNRGKSSAALTEQDVTELVRQLTLVKL